MQMKNVEDAYPLSPMQQLMLVHSLSASQSDVLFNQFHYTIHGPLNAAAFERAWQAIEDRHSILRTIFVWEGLKKPLQVVRKQANVSWEQKDWRTLTPDQHADRLQEFLMEDRARGFDLSQRPPMRLTLIQTDDDDHDLIWTSHHLLLDRWCIDIAMKELATLYTSFCTGQTPNLAAPPPYRDYIAWLQTRQPDEAKAYWQGLLSSVAGPTSLMPSELAAAKRARGANYHEYEVSLPAAATTSLRRIAREHQQTVNTVIQGAWALLLSQYSGQQDVVFGVTTSGRPPDLPGIDTMMGTFINNLPVKISISPEDTLADWLKTIQTRQLQLRQYEYVSPALIQEWWGLPQRLQLFESLLIYQSPTDSGLDLGTDVRMQGHIGQLRTNFPLTLVVLDTRTELRLWAVYDDVYFSADAVATIMEHWALLIQAMAENLEQRATDLPQPGNELNLPAAMEQYSQRLGQAQSNGHISVQPDQENTYVAPGNRQEQQLVEIWEQVLETAPIGIHDNFFALGGHSLAALRLIAQLEERLNQRPSIALLFQAPTVSEQAALLAEGGWDPLWRSLVPVHAGGSRPPLFLVPPVASTSVRFTALSQFLGADQPVYGFNPSGLDDSTLPHTSVEEMAAAYVNDLREFKPEGPYLLGGMCFGGHVAYEMASQLEQQGESVPALLMLDVGQPANGPSWSLPKRDKLYYWRRMMDFGREGHFIGAIDRAMRSRWTWFSHRLRHRTDPDLHKMATVFEGQLLAMRDYRAESVDTKIILLQSDQPVVKHRQQGWSELSSNVEVVQFDDTDHSSFLLEDEHVERIADTLTKIIDDWICENYRGRYPY